MPAIKGTTMQNILKLIGFAIKRCTEHVMQLILHKLGQELNANVLGYFSKWSICLLPAQPAPLHINAGGGHRGYGSKHRPSWEVVQGDLFIFFLNRHHHTLFPRCSDLMHRGRLWGSRKDGALCKEKPFPCHCIGMYKLTRFNC